MQFSSVKGRQVSQWRGTMKALVLSVLFGFVLTVSVANPINHQDAAPDLLRDVADDLLMSHTTQKGKFDLNGKFWIDDLSILNSRKGYK